MHNVEVVQKTQIRVGNLAATDSLEVIEERRKKAFYLRRRWRIEDCWLAIQRRRALESDPEPEIEEEADDDRLEESTLLFDLD